MSAPHTIVFIEIPAGSGSPKKVWPRIGQNRDVTWSELLSDLADGAGRVIHEETTARTEIESQGATGWDNLAEATSDEYASDLKAACGDDLDKPLYRADYTMGEGVYSTKPVKIDEAVMDYLNRDNVRVIAVESAEEAQEWAESWIADELRQWGLLPPLPKSEE